MRSATSVLFLALPALLSAQTVMTVQNGDWSTPSTWDCNCVPNSTQSVMVMHTVQAYGTLTLDHPQVQVTSSGDITTPFPETITLNTTFINEGHVLFQGNIYLAGLFNNAGTAEFIGQLTSDGTIVNDEYSLIQVEGDFTNYYQLQGAGWMCVVDTTINQGSITGTIDFCDWTPTVVTPPFIDENTGTVENSVTFCTNSICATSVNEASSATLGVWPNPAGDHIELTGFAEADRILVMDAAGRICSSQRIVPAARFTLDLSAFAPGSYRLLGTSAAGTRSLPFVIAR